MSSAIEYHPFNSTHYVKRFSDELALRTSLNFFTHFASSYHSQHFTREIRRKTPFERDVTDAFRIVSNAVSTFQTVTPKLTESTACSNLILVEKTKGIAYCIYAPEMIRE